MTSDEDIDRLLDIIADISGVRREKLLDHSSLFHDFGMAGHDGHDLLQAIGTAFQLDMSAVRYKTYFGEEAPYNPFHHLRMALQGRRLDEGIVRLEIADLKRSVTEGVWIEPQR
jgi:hypothetical protein